MSTMDTVGGVSLSVIVSVAVDGAMRTALLVGFDNVNDYYDPALKHSRLELLRPHTNFRFIKLDVADRSGMAQLFASEEFDRVVHLAAQAGVRYSLQNPNAYVDSNLVGFVNVLEGCRHHSIQHLVYASVCMLPPKKPMS